ncbi:MAG: PadR family transcriptional regulator, partial [Firmicutes bacterium]|nr:PadR family transcriptional regulator [Bacillota bacterium]
ANLSTSTIYNRLATLEKHGNIEGRNVRDGNRPERVVFSITEKGRDTLRREVLKHLTGFNDDPRTLGFAFLFGAEQKDLIRSLEAHERRLMQEVEHLEKMIADEPRPTLFAEGPFLNFCYSLLYICSYSTFGRFFRKDSSSSSVGMLSIISPLWNFSKAYRSK